MHSHTPPRTRRPRRRPSLAAFAAAVALLVLGACDSPEGIRIVAGTPTPSADEDGGSTVASTSTPEAVDVPDRPDNPFSGGVAVRDYLAGGRADVENCLPELVEAWGLPDVEGPRCLRPDLDGDGEPELLFLISVPGDPHPPGEVWFFDDAENQHLFMTSARALANAILEDVSFIGEPADLTGDGRQDVVIASQACGQRCETQLMIASAHHGSLQDVAPDDVDLGEPGSIKVTDANGDGLLDLVSRIEESDDPEAGPQRGTSRRLSWNGLRFAASEEREPPEFLIHLVDDADRAYRSGDFATARELYEAVTTDRTLRDWKEEQGERSGRSELVPYAYFRAALAARRQGDGSTRDLLERAAEHDDSMHGTAAALYLERIERGDDAPAACSAVERFLAQFRDRYLEAWDYGYANTERSISSLCR